MLATASFSKQLLHEKLLLFNPLPKLATRNPVALERGTIPDQRIFSICPPKNYTDQFSVKVSPVVKQTPENSTRAEKPNFFLTPFAASHESRNKNILRTSGLPGGKAFGLITPAHSGARQFLPSIFDLYCTSVLPGHWILAGSLPGAITTLLCATCATAQHLQLWLTESFLPSITKTQQVETINCHNLIFQFCRQKYT